MKKVGTVMMGKPSTTFDILWNQQSGEVLIDGLPVGWAGDEEDAERAALHFVRFGEPIECSHAVKELQ